MCRDFYQISLSSKKIKNKKAREILRGSRGDLVGQKIVLGAGTRV